MWSVVIISLWYCYDMNMHTCTAGIDKNVHPAGLPPPIGYGRGGHYVGRDYHHGPFRGHHLALGSLYMDAEEIDSILRIQWKSLHSGSPYAEDYYYLVSYLLAPLWSGHTRTDANVYHASQ